jgi:hypothetical protein
MSFCKAEGPIISVYDWYASYFSVSNTHRKKYRLGGGGVVMMRLLGLR